MEKYHILLIDDDLDEFLFLQMALEILPDLFKCTYVSSCDDALEIVEQIHPDFIFVDMNMPRINGLDCITAVKQLPGCHNVPIYLYSTSVDEQLGRQANALGAAGYLKKPVSADNLAKLLIELTSVKEECNNGIARRCQ